jgi:mannose-6-phosphate isomerase-like protein (cupin superfamily)
MRPVVKNKLTIEAAIEKLEQQNEFPFVSLIKHGNLSVEYFAPRGEDLQEPHIQDEIYVIASGKAIFYLSGKYTDCKKGDLIFVPAGKEHHFEYFSDDFATWVIFFGPAGGEK